MPVPAVNIPLTTRDDDAIAFRPIRSWSASNTRQAGRMADALSEKRINGDIPKPSTFFEIAS